MPHPPLTFLPLHSQNSTWVINASTFRGCHFAFYNKSQERHISRNLSIRLNWTRREICASIGSSAMMRMRMRMRIGMRIEVPTDEKTLNGGGILAGSGKKKKKDVDSKERLSQSSGFFPIFLSVFFSILSPLPIPIPDIQKNPILARIEWDTCVRILPWLIQCDKILRCYLSICAFLWQWGRDESFHPGFHNTIGPNYCLFGYFRT